MLRRGAVSMLMLVALAAVIAPGANAKVPVSGQKWPGGKVAVYDATPKSYRWAVDTAIKHLNQVGAKIKITKVKKRKQAWAVISASKKVPECAGLATLGRTHDRSGFVWVRSCGAAVFADYSLAAITAHELGHTLGLEHTTRDKCALMLPVASDTCLIDRKNFKWRCGLLGSADLKALQKRYGKRKSRVKQTWCAIPAMPFPSAARPGTLTLAGGQWTNSGWLPGYAVNLSFPAFRLYTKTGYNRVTLKRTHSTCAAADWSTASVAFVREAGGGYRYDVDPTGGSLTTEIDSATPGESWCYRLESQITTDFMGIPNPPVAASNAVEVTLPPLN